MDLETYDNFPLNKEKIEEIYPWLKENLELEGFYFQNKIINLQLPSVLELKVAQTDPGYRGDTVKQGTKVAKLETGVAIQVPLFINNGDVVKVNPQTGDYLGRA